MTGNRMTPDEACEAFSIKKATYYDRLKFLGIKATKDENGNAYLDDEQFELLDQLDQHIKATGKMDGFSNSQLAIVDSGKIISPSNVIESEIPETQPNFEAEFNSLMRRAAEIKAQNLVTPELVVLNLASQMTEEDLPEDLKQKVDEVRGAANPKYQPAQLANDLLAKYRSSRGGN